MLLENRKRTYKMFASNIDDPLPEDEEKVRAKLQMKIDASYSDIGKVPGIVVDEVKRTKILKDLGCSLASKTDVKVDEGEESKVDGISHTTQKAINTITEKEEKMTIPENLRSKNNTETSSLVSALAINQTQVAIRKTAFKEPKWHAPWKLKTVISGHTGWARCLAIDPMNRFFVSGSNDRTIKFWDLVEGKLMVTLTGHINTVRALAVSDRHPYLFSAGEDKQVKCWDLE